MTGVGRSATVLRTSRRDPELMLGEQEYEFPTRSSGEALVVTAALFSVVVLIARI